MRAGGHQALLGLGSITEQAAALVGEPRQRPRCRLLEDAFPPVLPGWGVLNRPPNPEPCWHLVKVLTRI